ncbi:hypothetical protein DICVIV_09010 [Dictyocaulus viviparus]|uniref:Uncharacterized protein n=1 Tax=Dictyocaulus viviparus TaxID=29172 RepID=A0A0D8XMA5_DICVI|nr:hypothetical protein DICVIV_09010 [Dictyocaulus viviparus]
MVDATRPRVANHANALILKAGTLPNYAVMSVVFSDDEDAPTHAAAIEHAHSFIVSKFSEEIIEADDKENLSNSLLENDPVSLRILLEKKRLPGDVFIIPMAGPSKSHDEYEFTSDSSESPKQRSSYNVSENKASAEWSAESRRSMTHRHSEHDSLLTSCKRRMSHRKKSRYRRLHHENITINQARNGNGYLINKENVCQCESSRNRPLPAAKLHSREELWDIDDDLPLVEIQSRWLQNRTNNPLDKSATSSHSVNENVRVSGCRQGDSYSAFYRNFSSYVPKEECKHRSPSLLAEGRCNYSINQKVSVAANTPANLFIDIYFDHAELLLRSSNRAKKLRKRKERHPNDDFVGPDQDFSLLDIKMRCSSLRSWKHMSNGNLHFRLLRRFTRLVDFYKNFLRREQMESRSSLETAMEQMSNLLDGLSLEEKVAKLLKRVAESEERNAKLKEKAAQVDKLTKANSTLEKKLEKANLILLKTEDAKGKLEELCRELQKMNKQIRDDSLSKIRHLENERLEAVEQLRSALKVKSAALLLETTFFVLKIVKAIEASMNEGRERSDALAADNGRLAEKLKELGNEYESRMNAIQQQYKEKDNYWQEYNKARETEIKLLKTKLEAAEIYAKKSALEKEELTRTFVEDTARIGGALKNEKALREEVKRYAGRYEEITKNLAESNAAFDKFKKEIDRVNANFKKVETDSFKWKQKYEEASKNVLLLTMAKKDLEDTALIQQKKLSQLEQLCRALSSRRNLDSSTPNDINPNQDPTS